MKSARPLALGVLRIGVFEFWAMTPAEILDALEGNEKHGNMKLAWLASRLLQPHVKSGQRKGLYKKLLEELSGAPSNENPLGALLTPEQKAAEVLKKVKTRRPPQKGPQWQS